MLCRISFNWSVSDPLIAFNALAILIRLLLGWCIRQSRFRYRNAWEDDAVVLNAVFHGDVNMLQNFPAVSSHSRPFCSSHDCDNCTHMKWCLRKCVDNKPCICSIKKITQSDVNETRTEWASTTLHILLSLEKSFYAFMSWVGRIQWPCAGAGASFLPPVASL